MQRVRLFRLGDDREWEDQGTGHATVAYMERSEELALFVLNEDDGNTTLLNHRISCEDIYKKQKDTIISWRDPEYSTELALSFQDTSGCSYIWDHICSVSSELSELPAVELSTLPVFLLHLQKVVKSSIVVQMLRLTELLLKDQDFFRKLVEVFRICEDLNSVNNLHMIFKIVKGIILLNSRQIFEVIFGDEYIMDIIGAFEYDPEVTHIHPHRTFLKEHVVFKEVIPIKDPLVLSKIHQTYIVGYLKDVVLARVLNEDTISNLNSIIHGNNALIVSLLKDDGTFIQELFSRLKCSTNSPESKNNLVYFLYEFCTLSKSLQMVQQLGLLRDMMKKGILEIITDILQSEDKKLVLTGTDILNLFLNQDPAILRTYVVRQEGITLLGLLVKGMITDFGDNMNCQFLEILRILLDSSCTLSEAQRDTIYIINIFYEKHLEQLIEVIITSCHSKIVNSVEPNQRVKCCWMETKPEILSNICELLCFCVLHHPYWIKCNFLLNNVIDKILLLTKRREKYLVVGAVRFVRTILSRHDEHMINHFVRNNLLKPIVDAFVDNGHRYNILNSAVLELFEYICKENLKLLVKYLVDSFWAQLEKFEYLFSIQSLKVKYEQFLDNGSGQKLRMKMKEPWSLSA